jgi:hypothetical protein
MYQVNAYFHASSIRAHRHSTPSTANKRAELTLHRRWASFSITASAHCVCVCVCVGADVLGVAMLRLRRVECLIVALVVIGVVFAYLTISHAADIAFPRRCSSSSPPPPSIATRTSPAAAAAAHTCACVGACWRRRLVLDEVAFAKAILVVVLVVYFHFVNGVRDPCIDDDICGRVVATSKTPKKPNVFCRTSRYSMELYANVAD